MMRYRYNSVWDSSVAIQQRQRVIARKASDADTFGE